MSVKGPVARDLRSLNTALLFKNKLSEKPTDYRLNTGTRRPIFPRTDEIHYCRRHCFCIPQFNTVTVILLFYTYYWKLKHTLFKHYNHINNSQLRSWNVDCCIYSFEKSWCILANVQTARILLESSSPNSKESCTSCQLLSITKLFNHATLVMSLEPLFRRSYFEACPVVTHLGVHAVTWQQFWKKLNISYSCL